MDRTPRTHGNLKWIFVAGVALLIVPLIVVLTLGSTCGVTSCSSFEIFARTTFLYPMLLGGLLIGYAMTKFAEYERREHSDENETE